MADYVSPGDAFSSGVEGFLMRRQADDRQRLLDSLAVQREQRMAKQQDLENEQAREALDEKRREADEKMRDREGSAFDKRVSTMLRGDVPDAALLDLDKKHGRGYFQPISEGGQPVFVGTAKERESLKTQVKVHDIMDRMKQTTPGSPEFIRAQVEYEIETGRAVPAGQTKAPTRPLVRENADRTAVATLVDGQWQPVTGEVPANALVMSAPQPRPDHSEADADRKNKQLTTVREHAYAELNKTAEPLESSVRDYDRLGQLLGMKTAQADALVAPLILKATAGGQGSGFRMTRAEIDNALAGRTKWETLEATLNKYSPDSQHFSIPAEQREAMSSLATAIRKKALKLHKVIVDARTQIDDSTDETTINHLRTKVRQDLYPDDDTDASAPAGVGGLPAVGSTFNGGKVLSVRPKS